MVIHSANDLATLLRFGPIETVSGFMLLSLVRILFPEALFGMSRHVHERGFQDHEHAGRYSATAKDALGQPLRPGIDGARLTSVIVATEASLMNLARRCAGFLTIIHVKSFSDSTATNIYTHHGHIFKCDLGEANPTNRMLAMQAAAEELTGDRLFLSAVASNAEVGLFGITTTGMIFLWTLIEPVANFSMRCEHTQIRAIREDFAHQVGIAEAAQFFSELSLPLFS
jgi:hypothetical protein